MREHGINMGILMATGFLPELQVQNGIRNFIASLRQWNFEWWTKTVKSEFYKDLPLSGT